MAYPYYPPPQPYLPDPTNVMGRRIGAFFIDLGVVLVFVVVLFMAFSTSTDFDDALADHDCRVYEEDIDEDPDDIATLDCDDDRIGFVVDSDNVFIVSLAPVLIIYAIGAFLYFAVLPAFTGATLGKLATSIRVVNRDTGRIAGFGRSIVRWLFFAVDGFYFIPGLITSLVSKGHRRVGDMVAGTLVIGREFVGQPPMVPGLTAPPAGPYAPPPYGYAAPPGYPMPPGYPGQPPPGQPPPPGAPPSAPGSWGAPPPPTGPPMGPPPAAWPPGPAATAPPTAPGESLLPPTQPSDEPTCPQPAPASPTGVPAWDRERGAWMQWDPARGAWMVWNPAIGLWVPA